MLIGTPLRSAASIDIAINFSTAGSADYIVDHVLVLRSTANVYCTRSFVPMLRKSTSSRSGRSSSRRRASRPYPHGTSRSERYVVFFRSSITSASTFSPGAVEQSRDQGEHDLNVAQGRGAEDRSQLRGETAAGCAAPGGCCATQGTDCARLGGGHVGHLVGAQVEGANDHRFLPIACTRGNRPWKWDLLGSARFRRRGRGIRCGTGPRRLPAIDAVVDFVRKLDVASSSMRTLSTVSACRSRSGSSLLAWMRSSSGLVAIAGASRSLHRLEINQPLSPSMIANSPPVGRRSEGPVPRRRDFPAPRRRWPYDAGSADLGDNPRRSGGRGWRFRSG